MQVFKREFYTHIHLDYVRIEILSCIKKIKIINPTLNNSILLLVALNYDW